MEVLVGLLDVIVDGDTIEKHVFHGVNDEFLGVAEGIAHGLELIEVFGNLSTVFHRGSYLRDELTKLINALGNLVEAAVLEVFDSSFHDGDEWVDVLDERFKVVNVLGFESTDDDAINELSHVKSCPFNVFRVRWWAPVSTALAVVFTRIAPVTIRPGLTVLALRER